MTSRTKGTGAIAVLLVVALSGIGAARVPGNPDFCLPLLGTCSAPSPSPVGPLPTIPTPTVPGVPLPGTVAGPGAAPTTLQPVLNPLANPNSPTFTLPAAQLGASSLTFTGLKQVTIVTVPLADGTTTPVIKLEADDIVISGFVLDVRRATGPSLVTFATTMELKGNVQVYLDSATLTLLNGTGLTLLANTPPPGNELPPQVLGVHFGLVGVTANQIIFTGPHQAIHE